MDDNNNQLQDIGIRNLNGELYYHHNQIKQYINRIKYMEKALGDIAFDKKLSIEEIRELASHTWENSPNIGYDWKEEE